SHHVNAGDEIAVALPPATPAEPGPEPIPLAVLYEDDDIIVIDKPRGLVVHPAAGNWTGTLVNALIAHCGASLSGVGGVRRPRLRPPPRQGHHRADGGGQERPRPSRARRPVRRPRPHRTAGARLSRLRLERAGPAQRGDRQADRPPSHSARADGSAPG